MKKEIYKIAIKLALKLHNFSYKLSSFFSSEFEQGMHPKHRLTNYHKFFIDNINPGDAVLDIGCGKGELSFDIAKKAKKVAGIDFDGNNINLAKKKYPASNIEYIHGNALKNLPAEKFDVIILSNVLEHIENRVEFLNGIKRTTSKILIRVPMINRDWITLYKKELGLEWKLDKGHFIEYTLESFENELKRADLKLTKYSIQFGEIWAVIN